MSLERIKVFCAQCGIEFSDGFIKYCVELKNILLDENKKYNLTRIREDEDFWNKHIADSLSLIKYFPELNEGSYRLADVGCGAGFPSLVLAIACKNLKITAIDSIRKKIDFVSLAAEKLGLDNIDVIWGRARELKNYNQYDFITARAVAEPIKIFKETRKLLNKTGKIIVFQTPKTQTDSIEILNNWTKKYSYIWKKSDIFELPGGDKRQFFYTKHSIEE